MQQRRLLKYLVSGFVALILILVIAIPFIPADHYRNEIQTQIGEALKLDVKLGGISLSSLPQPGLTVTDIKLLEGGQSLVAADELYLIPRLSSLFSDYPEITEIRVSGIELHVDHIDRLTSRFSSDSPSDDSSSVNIRQITITESFLSLDEKTRIGPIGIKIKYGDKLALESMTFTLEQESFELDIEPKGNHYTLQADATNWRLPVEPKLKFDSLSIDGVLNNDQLQAKSIEANAYDGNVSGNLVLSWKEGWLIDSRLNVDNIKLGKLLAEFDNHSADGLTSGQFTIRSEGQDAAALSIGYGVSGDIQIRDGHLYNTDLEKAARTLSKEWTSGGQTPFSEFNTHLEARDQLIRLTNTNIKSDILGANGKLDIVATTDLEGVISVGLDDPAGLVTMPLKVSGTVDEPKVRPTNEAIAGGAVGTAILGPGVGTAVGIKAGEIVGKLGGLFGGDDKKPQEKEPASDEAGSIKPND